MSCCFVFFRIFVAMMKIKRIVFTAVLLCVLFACTGPNEYKMAMSHVDSVMSKRPDSALLILDTLGRHETEFGKHFKMRYLLRLALAQAKTDVVFTTDSLTKELVKHFDSNGTKTEKAWAYYLHGCALSDIGKAPESLQAYYDAIEAIDTTRMDCDYNTLKVIYGQMFQIFNKQNLPHDEIWAMQHYIDCVRRTSSEEDYIVAKSQMIRPYCLLGENDTVLHIIDETYQSLMRLGKEQRAASVLVSSIFIYTERNQLDKAKHTMEEFEHKSGLFDNEGNITKGREGYYYIKGFYELAVKDFESAEFYFRKAIQYGHLSEGYRGLLSIYREKNNIDSVVHFSQLYEAAQDTLHNRMQIAAVHQMSELYNYNRTQKELEKEREYAQTVRVGAICIIVIVLLLTGGIIWSHYRKQKKRKIRIFKLENDLNVAMTARDELRKELEKLQNKDYESMIALKESKVAELTETIERLQAENDAYKDKPVKKETDNLEKFLNSAIVKVFIKKATDKEESIKTSETQWEMLLSQFSTDVPVMFRSFGEGKPLSQLEQRICILLILGISENVISLMAETSTSTVSNLKARANEKLFGKKEAQPLKNNLINALRQS